MTKSTHFFPVRTNYSTEDYARLLIQEIAKLYGTLVPLFLIRVLSSHLIFQLGLGTTVTLTAAFHLQMDGQAKMTIQTLKDIL